MRSSLLALCMILPLSGCSQLKAVKFLAPQSFGFVQVSPNLYVEVGTDQATQTRLQADMLVAEKALGTVYGSVLSKPVVHACMTEQCLQSFGGQGTFAKAYGNRILLSPIGRNWHFIAHEWSHAEMIKRLGFRAWKEMPQWFDEGLAVMVSEAPVHSEAHWQYLQAQHVAHPSREELYSLRSLSAWNAAGTRYSDNKNTERRARGETEIHSLYTTAGHEVRTWFQQAGTANLLILISKLNEGNKFDEIYHP